MFTSIRNLFNNRYKLISNNDGVVQENGYSTGENLDSALNQRYKKGRNINAEVSNALKYKNFKWPKKDQDWQTLISLIDNELDSFQEDVDVNKTILDLRDKIVNICKNNLSRRQKRKELPDRIKTRDSLIKEVYNEKDAVLCTATKKEVAQHFKNLNSIKSHKKHKPYNKNKNPDWDNYDTSEYTMEEFKHILDTKRNTNTNYDGMSFELVRKCESLQKILLSCFNKIAKGYKMPDYWYECHMYEKYKGKGDSNDAKNFRSLILMDTFSKLYWYFIDLRMMKHLDKYNIINTNIQKAFLPKIRGVEESIFIHQQVKPKSNCVCYLDIKNAYGSVQAGFIKVVLNYYGFDKNVIKTITHFIKHRKAQYKGETEKWNSGLPQGLTISNHIFILCMNFIIDIIDSKYSKYHSITVNNSKFMIQAFADDMVIYGKSIESMKLILTDLFKLLSKYGLDLQLKKCLIDYVIPLTEGQDKLSLNGIEIPELSTCPDFKYLGQYADLENVWTKYCNEVKTSLDKIKTLFTEKLPNPKPNDYWYAYQTIWRFKILWFLRVNNLTNDNVKLIETVEKNWFSQFNGLSHRISDQDYKIRKNRAIICRFSALHNSIDTRIVSLYKTSMGNEYYQASKMYYENTDTSFITNNGFRRNFYNSV